MKSGSVRAARGARLLSALLLLAPAPASGASNAPRPAGPPAAAPRAPEVAFEENRGQADGRVRYLWRGEDATLFLAPSEAVLALAPDAVVRMGFRGADPAPAVAGVGRLPGVSNYIVGGAARPVAGVARYAAVRYRELYPGVDFVMYGGGGGLEYDFVVAPGADPAAIALDFSGGGRPRVEEDGSLVFDSAAGEVRHRAPRAYQVAGGGRRPVACAYELAADGSVRFAVSGRDPALALVVDPVLRYSTYFGGNSPDRGQAIALDAAGNVYVAGRTFSVNFPTANAFQNDNAGNYDAFVTKLDNAGSAVLYSTYVGGADFDTAQGLAVNAAGEAFFTGYTGSTNFPTEMPFQASNAGGIDAIVVHLNAAGDDLVSSSYLGGSSADEGFGIALDPAGSAVVAGDTSSSNLATAGAVQAAYGGGPHDGFFAKVLATGALSSLSYIGGAGDDGANAVATDPAGNAYLTGYAEPGFPLVTPFQGSAGGVSAFVTKVDGTFASYGYSSLLGGSNTDIGNAVAADAAGNAYVTGYTLSSNFPTTTPFQATNGGNNDAFVVKVNAAGTAKVYSSYLGGGGDDRGNAIAVDQFGSAYVVGQTRSSNFPVLFPVQAANGGNALNDVFATKVGASGRILIYSTYLGGSITDVGYGVAVDAALRAHLTGYSDSTNYPRVSPIQNSNAGVDDAVLSAIVEPGDTPGVFLPSTLAWFLRNESSAGPADVSFSYGFAGGLVPLAGDWNGDGVDTPGLYEPSTGRFFLRNSNTPGPANLTFVFGAPDVYVPLAGDWNGDGVDTIGLYNPSTGGFFLKNTNAGGSADALFAYGPASPGSVRPVTGDWNGDGVDTVGVYVEPTGAWFLRDANSAGPATYVFTYGGGSVGGNPQPVAGDWNSDGIDTPGLFDEATSAWFLRNSNSAGAADVVFGYGPAGGGAVAVAGDWNR
jgi:hypothetical protein